MVAPSYQSASSRRSVVDVSGRVNADMDRHISLAPSAFGALRKSVFLDKDYNLPTKRVIYQACTLSSLWNRMLDPPPEAIQMIQGWFADYCYWWQGVVWGCKTSRREWRMIYNSGFKKLCQQMSITTYSTTPVCHMCCLLQDLLPGGRKEETEVHPGVNEAC